MKIQERANQLFVKYLSGDCTPEEWEELLVLMAGIDETDTETLTAPLLNLWEQTRNNKTAADPHPLDKDRLYTTIIRDTQPDEASHPAKIYRITRTRNIAAAVIGLLIIGGIVYQGSHRRDTPPVVVTTPALQVPPGIDKAVLTLANGQQVVLDSAHSGAIGRQGNSTVTNANGQLAYNQETKPTGETPVTYNSVTTGKANQYRLTLPDGSKVWLNAISSIRFPAAFTGKDRTVTITGEAYFDIANNPALPFHVRAGATDIQVLGTEFNVNAYADEPVLKTSLLSGAVKITSNNKSGLLAPGEEGSISPDRGLQIAPGNVELAVAWKNGFFQFDKDPLPAVLRQIGRWYDLDIRYAGAVPDRLFKGKLQRRLSLASALHLLQAEDINFRLEGRVLTIL
jgi:transmembrane sensor